MAGARDSRVLKHLGKCERTFFLFVKVGRTTLRQCVQKGDTN